MNSAVTLATIRDVREETAALIKHADWMTYPLEQARETDGPLWVTVMLNAVSPHFIQLAIRVYSLWSDSPEESIEAMETAVAWIDDQLRGDAVFPAPVWNIVPDQDPRDDGRNTGKMIAVATVDLGRDDL